jgi:hypothetical protein
MLQYKNIQAKPIYFLCKLIFIGFLGFPSISNAQYWIEYKLSPKGDTINRVDKKKQKQGPWWFRYEEVRGEPGFEEEGYFYNDKKQGPWKKFSLMGDLIAQEYFIAGFRDGKQMYFNRMGDLVREESWKAVDPSNPYDTIMVPDIDHPEQMIKKIIKHESAEIKHGVWNYYDGTMGVITKTERFVYGQPEQKMSQLPPAMIPKAAVNPSTPSSPPNKITKPAQKQKKGKE